MMTMTTMTTMMLMLMMVTMMNLPSPSHCISLAPLDSGRSYPAMLRVVRFSVSDEAVIYAQESLLITDDAC